MSETSRCVYQSTKLVLELNAPVTGTIYCIASHMPRAALHNLFLNNDILLWYGKKKSITGCLNEEINEWLRALFNPQRTVSITSWYWYIRINHWGLRCYRKIINYGVLWWSGVTVSTPKLIIFLKHHILEYLGLLTLHL